MRPRLLSACVYHLSVFLLQLLEESMHLYSVDRARSEEATDSPGAEPGEEVSDACGVEVWWSRYIYIHNTNIVCPTLSLPPFLSSSLPPSLPPSPLPPLPQNSGFFSLFPDGQSGTVSYMAKAVVNRLLQQGLSYDTSRQCCIS